MLRTSVLCFFASYLCAFGCELALLKWRHAFGRIVALGCGVAGLIAHTFYLLNRSSTAHLPPLLSSDHDWLLVFAWVAVLVYLFVSLTDGRLGIGLIMWPIILILIIAAQFVTSVPSGDLDYHRRWKILHASMLVLGSTGVLLALVLSLLYLWQHRRLKQRNLLAVNVKLPNLELIERLNRWAILAAVPLLTFGVASGFGLSIFARDGELPMIWTDPIVIGGALTWVLMGGLFVWLLTQKRSPGRQVALLTAWSCGFLLITMVGLQVLVSAIGMRHGGAAIPTSNSQGSAK